MRRVDPNSREDGRELEPLLLGRLPVLFGRELQLDPGRDGGLTGASFLLSGVRLDDRLLPEPPERGMFGGRWSLRGGVCNSREECWLGSRDPVDRRRGGSLVSGVPG